ncbi:hypothetical protein MKW94_029838, partial [Papaver nudicaule]|nr:hypothetical protein [Papaver nudicaule]
MERRRSSRVSKPVFKPEMLKMAEEAVNDALKRKSRGKRKVVEGSKSGDANADTISRVNKKKKTTHTRVNKNDEKKVKREAQETDDCKLTGEPIASEEAKEKWPERYDTELLCFCLIFCFIKKIIKSNKEILIVKSHHSAAEVNGITYHLNDDAYVRVIGTGQSKLIDEKRIFFSEMIDENPLECLVGKPRIAMIANNVDSATKEAIIANSNLYCDLVYQPQYNSFVSIPPEKIKEATDGSDMETGGNKDSCTQGQSTKSELSLLDLYAGCGAMSTGLCLGAKVGGVNLVTRWALDLNESACQSLALNHPETKVTNDSGDNFLNLLREWERLCQQIGTSSESHEDEFRESEEDCEKVLPRELEVEEIVGISFGNPANLEKVKKSTGKGGKKVTIPKGTELYFK